VQINVGVSYKIQYILDSQRVEIVVSKISSSNKLVIVSNSLTATYQRLSNYQSNSDFLNADAFARSQLQQLQSAQIIAVWVQYTSTNYRIQYQSNQNVNIEVIISYDITTDSYVFQLLSPLSLLSYVVARDPLCRTFKKNVCIECSYRSYFDVNRRCQQVNPQCNTFTSDGQCTTCYDGYSLSKGSCILASNLLPPNCREMWSGVCSECNIGYALTPNGVCIARMAGCLTSLSDGRCVSCSVGYLLIDGICRRNY
jgi:hypothetical protein